MTTTWRQRYLTGFLLLVISLMIGCTSFIETLVSSTSPASPSLDNSSFEYALSVYQRGDYTQAARLFNALSATDPGDGQRYKAQFGEICCRLMLAESQDDLAIAMEMWKKLKYSTSGDGWRMEQVLLDPLINRLSVRVEKPSTPSASPGAPPAPVILQLPATNKEMETELTTLKKKAEQITQLQRQLDSVTAENLALKQKIKALEAIDQNIQKKKTEISAPSE